MERSASVETVVEGPPPAATPSPQPEGSTVETPSVEGGATAFPDLERSVEEAQGSPAAASAKVEEKPAKKKQSNRRSRRKTFCSNCHTPIPKDRGNSPYPKSSTKSSSEGTESVSGSSEEIESYYTLASLEQQAEEISLEAPAEIGAEVEVAADAGAPPPADENQPLGEEKRDSPRA